MSVVSYKCPNCDGPLQFEPESQKFRCEYCNGEFTREAIDKPIAETQNRVQESAGAADANEGQGAETTEYTCPSCGASIVTDSTTAATQCYYCHNPVVLSGRLSGEYKPDALIPFAIDRQDAINRFLGWVSKKKFVPPAFFSKKQIDNLAGVYFPYWLVECDVQARMQANATQVRTWMTGDIQYTETRHFNVVRSGALHFANITKNALKKANSKLAEAVAPFDATGLQEFSPAYLSGFLAEKRDVEKVALADEVKGDVDGYATDMLRSQITGYATVSPTDMQANVTGETWRYALMPVWVLTYKGPDKKLYYYALNAQTGKVCGELPVDKNKLWMVSGIVAAAVFAILAIVGYFL